jgi:hypothetical protein
VRRISYWFNNPQDNSDYNPNLYISLNKWFEEAHPLIEENINNFEAEYRQLRRRYNKPTPTNLMLAQLQLAAIQKENIQMIVIPANKNIGQCMIHCERYITRASKEHLGDKETYAIICDRAASTLMDTLHRSLDIWLEKYSSDLTDNDKEYLRTASNQNPRKMAEFCMRIKVHKKPWKTRPIVCCVGTFMNHWGKGYSVLLANCPAICSVIFVTSCHFCMEQNVLAI